MATYRNRNGKWQARIVRKGQKRNNALKKASDARLTLAKLNEN